jgi:hypothetical protein
MSGATIEQLLEALRSSLHARRRETSERVEAIKALADAYLEARDVELVRHFADSHGLPQPKPTARSADALARALAEAVKALPENQRAEVDKPATLAPKSLSGPAASLPPREAEPPKKASSPYPELQAASANGPLVVVGGAAKSERVEGFPESLRARVEFVDTTRQGTHAIGNLEQRIRDRRVAALILLEGIVSHKHSEPLVSAARKVGMPFAFGGKGGRAALARALAELERALGNAEE